ncbi:MAG: WD40/YVTN/BNR-like repeat-containing protein, partial [Lewinella sp.]|uniref:WD40/YVTN/BNR-like repeat-containing protein n=1 Tax=Lewinella sp. TaxID=2004506 RepID=UPI003D6B8D3E
MRLLSTFLFTIVISFFEIAFVYAQPSLDVLQYRAVGPTRGGRVTAVAGTAMEPGTFYLGATGGGIWKTTDYGTSWHNVSDGFLPTPSIGAISVAQKDPNIVYTGTGSDGLRSNVIVGKGVYKSIDAGNSWSPVGLERVGQIGALILHPEDHNTVFVAGIGQPFQANSERGIFRTRNGGRSWEKVLYLSDEIGFSDVEMLPGNPNILFATAWKAVRKPWTIISGGTAEEGGIYKSVDGGDTWDKITKGLPGNLIGKIDVAVCPADSRVVYALVEAPNKEGGLYKSVDQGASFTQVSDFGGLRSRPFYYTNIRVNPQDCEVVYSLATGYYRSDNSGKDWQRMNPPHGDSHDMWINPDNPQLFIQANDGGANVTHNGGQTWSTQFNQPTAEIYQVEVDDQFPYWLYGGQQDNYTTIAVPSLPPDSRQAAGMGWVINTGGCETGPAVPKPGNHNIVYSNCKGRFGVFDKRTGVERSYYVGASNMYGHNPKDLEFRFQRVSPIHVSPHNPDVVYHTSQYVHRTKNDGQTWEIISPDLTAFEADKQVISGSPITRDITG